MADPKPTMSAQVDAILKKKIASGDMFPGTELVDDMAKMLEPYQVFYIKGSIDDESFLIQLERLQTQGIKGDDVVLLSEDTFVFQDEYYVVLKYMQKITR